jgi:hypothetical protein
MKKTLISTLIACSAFSAFFATAADNVDLKVTGVLVTGACTPTLDGGGSVNFGNIPVGDLSPTATNQLGSRNINLTITCDQAIPIGFTTTDNRLSSVQSLTVAKGSATNADIATPANLFGLGQTAGGVNLGAYTIATVVGSATADGNAIDVLNNSIGADSNNRNWVKSASGSTADGGAGAVQVTSAAATGTLVPVAGKVFVYPLKVTAAVQGTNALNITTNTNLDGDTTISLVYL